MYYDGLVYIASLILWHVNKFDLIEEVIEKHGGIDEDTVIKNLEEVA